jgi:hypothetical protein
MRNSNRVVRDALIRLIGRVDYHVADRTNPADVSRVLRSLRPVDGGYNLVRLGPDGDGGYLVPDDLAGIEYAFSPGVSTESGFEAALAARGQRVFLADYSVDRPAEPHPNFVFEKRYVGGLSDDVYMTLEQWKNTAIGAYDGDLLLQMDIEGAEYETLLACPTSLLAQFRVMVIEFHYLHELLNRRYFELVSRAFAKLLQTHSVVHIHPNNCCGSVKADGLELPRIAEFTLQRNDRLKRHTFCRTFPHPLDRNNTRKPTLVLPSCWYDSGNE